VELAKINPRKGSKMFKFKIVYKKNGKNESYEVEIEFNLPSLDKAIAATKLGISPSQIISISKK